MRLVPPPRIAGCHTREPSDSTTVLTLEFYTAKTQSKSWPKRRLIN